MRRPALAALVLLAGCYSSSVPSTTSRPATTRIQTDRGNIEIETTEVRRVSSDPVLVSPDSAWRALPAAYAGLGLLVKSSDPRSREVGTGPMTLHGRLGKSRVSTFVSCGDRLGIQNADEYGVTLTVATRVEPSGASTSVLRSQVTAWAKPEGLGANPITCTTTGVIERRIAEAMGSARGGGR